MLYITIRAKGRERERRRKKLEVTRKSPKMPVEANTLSRKFAHKNKFFLQIIFITLFRVGTRAMPNTQPAQKYNKIVFSFASHNAF